MYYVQKINQLKIAPWGNVEVETTAKENIDNNNEPLQHGLLPVGTSANAKYQAV
jgi:hypothetical protein